MLVTLYTSRVVLNVLGIDDFGIYNLIGGIVVLVGFLQRAMTSATQRFITYELGRGDIDKIKKTFSMSMTCHISIAILVFFLAETVGLWFVNTQIIIPVERLTAANWVYQFSVFAFIVNIIRVPYNATIIAYEEMSFYAYLSIIEAILKLAVVFLLTFVSFDKLSAYGVMIFIVPFFITLVYKFYCNNKFKLTKYKFEWDKKLYWKLMSFSGWSMWGGVGVIGMQQGGNILLDIFSGVVANAALGIAHQVGAAVSNLSSSLLLAFQPQIIKTFAKDDSGNTHRLVFLAASFSYYLILIFAVPFLLNTEIILQLWLKNVPDYAVIFCQLIVLYNMIDIIQAPLITNILATGNIKVYEIWLNALLILNIPISWYLLSIGLPVYWVLLVRVGINFISSVIRTIYVKYFVNFPSWKYVVNVVGKALLVTAISFSLSLLIKGTFNAGISGFIYTTLISVTITALVVYLIGINKNERTFINGLILGALHTKNKRNKINN